MSHCSFDFQLVSMPLRHWQVINDASGESIHADDFYTYVGCEYDEYILLATKPSPYLSDLLK
jgi:hypothetical protein